MRASLLLSVLIAGCGGDGVGAPDGGTDACPEGLEAVGPACVPIFDDCGDSEIPALGGGCERVGLPAACWDGWVPDGEDGCAPILPASPCPDGTMGIIGQSDCQPIADCAEIDADLGQVRFVDASYDGSFGSPTGTETRPYPTIQEAIDQVPAGGQVVVAAGTYVENLRIEAAARLDGRCGNVVTVRGTAGNVPAIAVENVTAAVRLSGLRVTGPGPGVAVQSSADVSLQGLSISGCGGVGLTADQSTVSVRISALVDDRTTAIWVTASTLDLEDVVMAGTRTASDGRWGYGVELQDGSTATVHRAVLSENRGLAFVAWDSTAHLDEAVIRGTFPNGLGDGYGIHVQALEATATAELSIVRSLLASNRGVGLSAYGATLTVDTTTIRDTLPQVDDAATRGLEIVGSPHAIVRGSLAAGNAGDGLLAATSTLEIDGFVSRDNVGRGMAIQMESPATVQRSLFQGNTWGLVINQSEATVERVVAQRNGSGGIWAAGAPIDLSGIAVRDTLPEEGGWHGRGIEIALSEEAAVRTARLERNHGSGLVVFGATAQIENVGVFDTRSDAGGYGGGIDIQQHPTDDIPSSVSILRAAVVRTFRSGIAVVDSVVDVEDTLVREVGAVAGEQGDGVGVYRWAGNAPVRANLRGLVIEDNARAGAFFYDSEGGLSESTIRGNETGVAVVHGATPTIAGDNVFEDNGRSRASDGYDRWPPPEPVVR